MTVDARLDLDTLQLGDIAFWELPWAQRLDTFRRLREEKPFSFHEEPEFPGIERGPGFWAVTRHADVLDISRRPEEFCSGQGAISINDMTPDLNEFYGSLISMDNPRHARLRRIVSGTFTPKMLAKTMDDISRVAREVVDGVAAKGEIDFVWDLAAPFPLIVICDMMGIPESERSTVLTQANIILSGGDPEYIPEGSDPIEAFINAGITLAGLMTDLAAVRRRHPTDDLTSALVNTSVDGEQLTEQELASFFILLSVAGHETTRNALSHGAWALHTNPDQKAIWAADLDGVTPTAVEEVVRYSSPVIFMRRTATREARVGGHDFHEGEKVLLYYGSANRDAEVFDDPDRFDVRRTPNPHVGFGGPGPHFCLGAHLARREIEVMFRELLLRLPDLEATGEPEQLRSSFINGIRHLPVRFTPTP